MRIEIVEAAVLIRLEAIHESSDHPAERDAIADALAKLSLLRKDDLAFVAQPDAAITGETRAVDSATAHFRWPE